MQVYQSLVFLHWFTGSWLKMITPQLVSLVPLKKTQSVAPLTRKPVDAQKEFNINLRKFQQTPRRYAKIQIWKDSLHKEVGQGPGYVPGVCGNFLRIKRPFWKSWYEGGETQKQSQCWWTKLDQPIATLKVLPSLKLTWPMKIPTFPGKYH